MMEFGNRLKELRAAKAKKLGRRRIPQREVARELNISPGAYGSWESGRTRPDVSLLPKVADYFEVSIDFLLGHTTSFQTNLDSVNTDEGLIWSLQRAARTPNEQKGLEVWQRMTHGESSETITMALNARSEQEVESYLFDVIYADMVSIDHLPRETDLAAQVRQRFGLREVVVVPTIAESHSLTYILLGEAARSYFKRHVYEGLKIGIAGGFSVSRLVYSLRRGECQSIEVYPLAISPVVESIALDANSLVGTFAYRHFGYNVRGYSLNYVSPLDWDEAKNIRQSALTRRILAKAKSVDIAFMGLGTFRRRLVPIYWLGDLLQSMDLSLEAIGERGAVGDILYHFVDQEGQLVASEINNLICSIELEDLRQMVQWGAQVVAMASGRHKVEIARAAIKAGYANVFIIDDELAQGLLETTK